MVHQYVSLSVAAANCPSLFLTYRAVVLSDSCPSRAESPTRSPGLSSKYW